MKNWQLRWFVLRSDQLYFYKDEEETKPQVIIQPCLLTTANVHHKSMKETYYRVKNININVI